MDKCLWLSRLSEKEYLEYIEKKRIRDAKWATIRQGSRTRKLKRVPRHCSSPKQICIKCKKTRIHPNEKRKNSKICKACED